MTPAKKKYLARIDSFADKLTKAAQWQESKKSIGYVERAAQDSYVYEFYCYLRLLCDLQKNYEVRYVSGSGGHPHKFPKAAAEKRYAPRFDLYDKTTGNRIYQVCVGTKVNNNVSSKSIHPDITFQSATAPADPDHTHLELMMDAKFKKNPSDSLPIDEVLSFIGFVNTIFELDKKSVPPIAFDKLADILGNTILTNGLAHDNTGVIHTKSRIKEVEKFDVRKKYKVIG